MAVGKQVMDHRFGTVVRGEKLDYVYAQTLLKYLALPRYFLGSSIC